MAGPNREGPGSFYPGLVLVISAAFGALLYQQSSFEPRRFTVPESKTHVCRSLQDVDARLWEDPFACIGKTSPNQTEPKSLASLFDNIGNGRDRLDILGVIVNGGRQAGASESRRRCRYAVLSALHVSGYVPVRPHHMGVVDAHLKRPSPPELSVSNALQRTSWPAITIEPTLPCEPYASSVPKQVATPGIKEVCRKPAEAASSQSAKPAPPLFPVPFEVYERADNDRESVWVLWLDEDLLGECPLQGLMDVWCGMHDTDSVLACSPPGDSCVIPRVGVKFIGPESTTTLRRMMREVRSVATGATSQRARAWITARPTPVAEYQEACYPRPVYREKVEKGTRSLIEEYGRFLEDAEFYSPTATADDEFILREAPREQGSIAAFLTKSLSLETSPIRPSKARFIRTTPSDRVLAKALVKELALRGVAASEEAHIVLISEWDTLYGRALPQSIRAEIAGRATNFNPDWVRTFSYPRGLDGQTGETRSKAKENDKNDGGKESDGSGKEEKQRASSTEIAEGNGQFDYLRRLAGKIRHLQNALLRKGGEIKAIGLFGTDAYDKLMILEALRPDFPGIVFFTTDLDALLLHPKKMKWTRNLVVVSGFGFELSRELQQDTLPFRGSYQTAQYLAALMALNAPEDPLTRISQDGLNNDWLEPRVYEIGRTGAIDMTVEQLRSKRKLFFRVGASSSERLGDSPEMVGLHPEKPTLDRNGFLKYMGLFFLLALLAAFGLPHVFTWIKERYEDLPVVLQTKDNPCRKFWVGLVLLVFLGAICLLMGKVFEAMSTEPFFWAEGVSVWPTEIVRAFVFLLAVFLLWYGNQSLRECRGKLSREYFGEEDTWYSSECLNQHKDIGCLAKYKRIIFCELYPRKDGSDDNRTEESEKPVRKVEDLWLHYVYQSTWRVRLARVVMGIILYFVLASFTVRVLGTPHAPFRGAQWLDTAILLPAVAGFIFLLFFVLDATRLCMFLADSLVDVTYWPGSMAEDERKKWSPRIPMISQARQDPYLRRNMAVDCWLDIKFFAELSAPIVKLIYYPFLVLSLLILSRSNIFDNWETPLGLAAVFGMGYLFAIYCAVALRQSAERLRLANLKALNDMLIAVKGDPNGGGAAAQLEMLIRRIDEMQEGAFAKYSKQPVFRALMLPFGATGVILLEYLPFL